MVIAGHAEFLAAEFLTLVHADFYALLFEIYFQDKAGKEGA